MIISVAKRLLTDNFVEQVNQVNIQQVDSDIASNAFDNFYRFAFSLKPYILNNYLNN